MRVTDNVRTANVVNTRRHLTPSPGHFIMPHDCKGPPDNGGRETASATFRRGRPSLGGEPPLGEADIVPNAPDAQCREARQRISMRTRFRPLGSHGPGHRCVGRTVRAFGSLDTRLGPGAGINSRHRRHRPRFLRAMCAGQALGALRVPILLRIGCRREGPTCDRAPAEVHRSLVGKSRAGR